MKNVLNSIQCVCVCVCETHLSVYVYLCVCICMYAIYGLNCVQYMQHSKTVNTCIFIHSTQVYGN